ncbi:alanine racemase (plasmid) [Arthrobacter sp. StoSoilB3]|nr:alanine racemase [Arthrobacter sp. StoSoilB3]
MEVDVYEGHDKFDRQALIDLDAIRHNVRHFVEICGSTRVMAVVKADAYGHGALPVAHAALEAGAGWLGVAHLSEALALRGAGIQAPILAWLHTPDSDFAGAVRAGIDIGISGWEVPTVVAHAQAVGRPARIHLKVDTGLGRNGCPPAEWPTLIHRAKRWQAEGLLEVVGVFSHLSVADDPEHPETAEQVSRFRAALSEVEKVGLDVEVRHLANTAAALSRPDTHFDMVRVGLGLYGLSPFGDRPAEDFDLQPAMTLRARVANCKNVAAGQGVSYGLHYVTDEPTTLVLVPIGYADGVPRSAEGAQVTIGRHRLDVVGRVAMDQIVVESRTNEGSIIPGDEVVIFGAGPDVPGAGDLARASGTINYEIVTRVGSRVPRAYAGLSKL